MTLVAVILAAGSGSRFDGETHKLVAPFRGSTVLGHAIAAAVQAEIDLIATTHNLLKLRTTLAAA